MDGKVVVALDWQEARALAYAASRGIQAGGWSDTAYRTTAEGARTKLLSATSQYERAHPEAFKVADDA